MQAVKKTTLFLVGLWWSLSNTLAATVNQTLNTCPSLCRCQYIPEKQLIVNCSGSSIADSFLALPQNTTNLDLRHAGLNEIRPYALSQLKRLKVLYVGGNNIKAFSEYSFAGLETLEYLDLSPIPYDVNLDYTLLPPGLFQDLISLKILKLNDMNRFQLIQQDYIDRTMAPLRQLEQLFLPYVPLGDLSLGPGYSNLTSLKTLVFNETFYFAFATDLQLKGRAFMSLKDCPIERLAFINCAFSSVERDVMSSFPNLKILDVEGSIFTSTEKLQDFICDLNNTMIETLRMNDMVDMHTKSPFEFSISASTFECLKHKTVRSLELINNDIVEVKENIFQNLKHLEYLDLSYNNILYHPKNHHPWVVSLMAKISITNLKFVKIDNNVIHNRSPKPKCEITHSFWDGHPEILLTTTKTTDQSDTPIAEELSANITIPLPVIKMTLPKQLEYLSLNWWATIKYGPFNCDTVNGSLYFYSNNLRSLSAVGLRLPYACYTPYGLHRLEFVDLSHNVLYYVPKTLFHDLPALRELYLKDNKMGSLIGKGGLDPLDLPRLQYLDLSQNSIRLIPKHFFVNLISLKWLDLSNNDITTVSFSWMNFAFIEYMNLSNNKLHALSPAELKFTDRVNKSSNLVFNMSNNPVDCASCDGEEFTRWVIDSNITVSFSNNSTCHANGTNSTLNMTLQRLERECDVIPKSVTTLNHWLSLGISLTITASVTCGVVLAYIYRWTIQYRFYLLRRRLRRHGFVKPPPGHVYVSYDDGNYQWVMNELLRHLEENELDVIIDERDFIGGASLAEAIVEAVDNSRKTVLVLSENFVLNSWCEFEFEMSLARGYNTVIPVMFETVPFGDMTKSLRKFIKAKGYIKWTGSQEGQRLFWKRLMDAIFDVNNQYVHDAENDDVEME
ncbi:toll-like receptor 4 [Lingula anatina]|uniref:Toll-like receptor 4 n=1 Tax=Lingula anatina TaxID=7574 RepID=A0A2R2MS14_LINAN|nr:toll-like receptor 4 [Lingula anatina]|eukprot:XP_023933049.1 toll-like receptor 4 [Lingula anatina]